MYKAMMIISIMVRQFYIENPFETLGDGLEIMINSIPILLTPETLNWLAAPVMHLLTYGTVGIYYVGGSVPVLGSLLYLIFYCVHTYLLHLMSLAGFAKESVIFILVLYVGCHIAFTVLRNKLSSRFSY